MMKRSALQSASRHPQTPPRRRAHTMHRRLGAVFSQARPYMELKLFESTCGYQIDPQLEAKGTRRRRQKRPQHGAETGPKMAPKPTPRWGPSWGTLGYQKWPFRSRGRPFSQNLSKQGTGSAIASEELWKQVVVRRPRALGTSEFTVDA